MSPELGGVLLIAILYGPIAVWLVFRAFRGPRVRFHQPFNALSEPIGSSELARDEPVSPVASDGFWVCGTCSSLNRREANRCYACRTGKGFAGERAPGQLPVSLEVSGMADGTARSSGATAGASVALAPPRVSLPAPERLVRAGLHARSATPPEVLGGVPMCPLLGVRDDPATRYDFPDPRNCCHAVSRRNGTPVPFARRFINGVTGAGRSQPISVEDQEVRCLTPAHEQCARYLAVEIVTAQQ
jgi:hypothetical protein